LTPFFLRVCVRVCACEWSRADVSVLRSRIEATERTLRDARSVFVLEAREFVEVQADVEELQEAKRAISSQILALSNSEVRGSR